MIIKTRDMITGMAKGKAKEILKHLLPYHLLQRKGGGEDSP